jgi:inorganic triphosphatase YgiF
LGRETELKLSYAPEALERLRRSRVLRMVSRGPTRTQRLVTTYFDTDDGVLAGQGISLRVRRAGRRKIQGVKAPESSLAGLAVRREWEMEIKGDVPDLAAYPPGTVDTVLNVGWLAERLRPVFTTAFERSERDAALDGETRVRLAIDDGEIHAGDAREAIAEVELELAEGGAVALFDLALALHRAVPGRIGTRAKSHRGVVLASGRGPDAETAEDVRLGPDIDAGEAFLRIAAACLEHWLGNVDVVLADRDPEGIHQMRVALRRLRSAFRIFRPLVADEVGTSLAAEVRWLASALGPARDWDVFEETALAPVEKGLGAVETLAPLAEAANAARARAHAAAVEAVGSIRHTDLVLRLGRWLAAGAWAGDAPDLAAEPATDFAARVLDRHWRRVRKRGRKLTRLPAEQLHELRIEIKKLRYAVEFFASLHDARAVRRFLSGLKGLQDFLGHLNDLDVARRLMAELGDGGPVMARAEGLVIGWHAAALARDRKHLTELWASVLAQEPYWR